MPRVDMTPENKGVSVYEYPKFTLDKGERARILAIEQSPLAEYVHTLRAPKVVNGRVAMETVDNFGNPKEVPQYNFLSRPVCLGDLGVLKDKGVDPEDCPACAVAVESDAIEAPTRRFAMHIVWYSTKAGSFEVQDPFTVKLVAWVFPYRVFNSLVDFSAEWGDLRQHDLLAGPCENKQFQKFDVVVASKAEWLASADRTQFVKALYEDNQAKDLSALIGRKVSREMLEEDVRRVQQAHHLAFGRSGEDMGEEGQLLGAAALDELLTGTVSEEIDPETEAPEAVPDAEEKPKRKPRAKKADAEVPEAEAPEVEEAPVAGKTLDLDAILNDLG
jgi:hypothetical protein